MKVNIEFESVDMNGEVTKSKIFAVMEVRRYDYRLVYVEDLSGDGKITKSSMILSHEGMRLTRTGELTTDFMYGKNMVHNTSYGTAYGTLPITVETDHYEFTVEGVSEESPELPDDFEISAHVLYKLIVNEDEPLDMNMKIRITAHTGEKHG